MSSKAGDVQRAARDAALPISGAQPTAPVATRPSLQEELGEAAILTFFQQGAMGRAASAALALYGRELLRFLQVRLRDTGQTEEAFSMVCEELWRGLAGFAWRSSLRTWLFVLARHAATRVAHSGRRDRALFAFDAEGHFREVCAHVRTTTSVFRQTETKRRVRALREQLADDQQTLLVLRVERGLPWRDLAVVMGEAEAGVSEDEIERASARVRTRFQVAKKQLRELARQAGLISAD